MANSIVSSLLGSIQVDDKLSSLFGTATKPETVEQKQKREKTARKAMKKKNHERIEEVGEDSGEPVKKRKKSKRDGKAADAGAETVLNGSVVNVSENAIYSASEDEQIEAEIEKKPKESVIQNEDSEKVVRQLSNSVDAKTRRQGLQTLIEKNGRTMFVGNLPTTVVEKVQI